MGKGSSRRPTNEEAFQSNYEKIFGKKNKVSDPINDNPKDYNTIEEAVAAWDKRNINAEQPTST